MARRNKPKSPLPLRPIKPYGLAKINHYRTSSITL